MRDYLSLENETGILPQDGRFEVEPLRDGGQQFVPPSPLQQRAVERIYSFFRVNEAIVQAKYDENQWLAYYEAEIAPLAQQMSEEFTRKLFSRRSAGSGIDRVRCNGADVRSMRTSWGSCKC